MVGSIIWVLLEIYLAFQQLKNFENPLRIDKVIAMSLVWFLGHPVYVTLLHPTQRVELRSDILHHHTYHSIISVGTVCRNLNSFKNCLNRICRTNMVFFMSSRSAWSFVLITASSST